MLKGILQSEQYFCNHIGVSENDERDIEAFSVRDEKGLGLQRYIRYNAFTDEENGLMRTYIVRDIGSDEFVGYFSIKAGLISLNEREDEEFDFTTGEERKTIVFDTLPGIELANFAVNQSYIDKHPDVKGVGLVIFDSFILPIIRRISQDVGVKILYIFALPYDGLIKRYRDYGFERLNEPLEDALHQRIKPYYDKSCKFMYMIL